MGLTGTCYRVVHESMMRVRRGTHKVPSEISVEKIRFRVKLVGAFQDLGVRH